MLAPIRGYICFILIFVLAPFRQYSPPPPDDASTRPPPTGRRLAARPGQRRLKMSAGLGWLRAAICWSSRLRRAAIRGRRAGRDLSRHSQRQFGRPQYRRSGQDDLLKRGLLRPPMAVNRARPATGAPSLMTAYRRRGRARQYGFCQRAARFEVMGLSREARLGSWVSFA